ncbi:MAG TPA: hypothetical protein VEA80_08735 [Vitreimonas sp.]|uniref:hypothetical protein n=1 Tax=Vitreimonas sp. TaxID=3069702 RepID=UPI002D5D0072|nr:hypothetical protein [Vitreimonas sp.]HYD87545.1 hypothetical protein [Vitreimonas sp.]
MKSVTKTMRGAILAAGLASASFAAAEEGPSAASVLEQSAGEPELLSMDDMDALAGGTGVDVSVITEGTLTAINTGNTVSGDTVNSGQVNIGSNAFSGYGGLGNFVINTGHNNNLQSNMSVSVVLAPPPPTPGS